MQVLTKPPYQPNLYGYPIFSKKSGLIKHRCGCGHTYYGTYCWNCGEIKRDVGIHVQTGR